METFFYISHFLGEIFSGNTFMSPPPPTFIQPVFFQVCHAVWSESQRCPVSVSTSYHAIKVNHCAAFSASAWMQSELYL